MKQVRPFYTVVETQSGHFAVRYVTPPDWTVQEFGRHGDDPAEAVNEFRKCEGFQRYGRLTKAEFDRRVLRHSRDVMKLNEWIGAKV